jgi:hypothetical protein
VSGFQNSHDATLCLSKTGLGNWAKDLKELIMSINPQMKFIVERM